MFVVDPGVSHRAVLSYEAYLMETGGGAVRANSAHPAAHINCVRAARAQREATEHTIRSAALIDQI